MSKFNVNATKYVRGTIYLDLEIDPADYLEAENERDLGDFVWDDMLEYAEKSEDLDTIDWIEPIHIPSEFIEEWKKLKSEQ